LAHLTNRTAALTLRIDCEFRTVELFVEGVFVLEGDYLWLFELTFEIDVKVNSLIFEDKRYVFGVGDDAINYLPVEVDIQFCN
jgi:hypothetical protein